jgi:hypothetical protein
MNILLLDNAIVQSKNLTVPIGTTVEVLSSTRPLDVLGIVFLLFKQLHHIERLLNYYRHHYNVSHMTHN